MAVMAAVLDRVPVTAEAPAVTLRPRERDVLLLVAQGLTNEEIAQSLTPCASTRGDGERISRRTVDRLMEFIRGKFGVCHRYEAVQAAYRLRLIDVAKQDALSWKVSTLATLPELDAWERETLCLIANERTLYSEVASHFGFSRGKFAKRQEKLFAKIGIRYRSQVIPIAIQLEVISFEEVFTGRE